MSYVHIKWDLIETINYITLATFLPGQVNSTFKVKSKLITLYFYFKYVLT